MLGIPASGRHGKREIGRRTTNKRLPGLLPAVIFCDIRQGPRRGNQLRHAAREAAAQGRFGKSRFSTRQIRRKAGQLKADSAQGRRDARPVSSRWIRHKAGATQGRSAQGGFGTRQARRKAGQLKADSAQGRRDARPVSSRRIRHKAGATQNRFNACRPATDR